MKDETRVTLIEMIWPALWMTVWNGYCKVLESFTAYTLHQSRFILTVLFLAWSQTCGYHSTQHHKPLLNTQNHMTGHRISIKQTNPRSEPHTRSHATTSGGPGVTAGLWDSVSVWFCYGEQFISDNESWEYRCRKAFLPNVFQPPWKTEWNLSGTFIAPVMSTFYKRNSSHRDENYAGLAKFQNPW